MIIVPLTILDYAADILMLGVAVFIVILLSRLSRKAKAVRKNPFTWVLLCRTTGDACAVGTYASEEEAIQGIRKAACSAMGIAYNGTDIPDKISVRFNKKGTKWLYKGDGFHCQLWITEVKDVTPIV